ncbi:hypothetical protein [Salinicoccus carnicancri]|uniref:hypothetical protein n=1 Tax=Salinicoccus carnicancri TaxID=558170 RepID=UPI00031908A5|nr:hypothetical protein [Salinicoccus carnicancri]
METIKTEHGVVIEYPAGCGNAPRKYFLVEAVAAVLEEDAPFLEGAVTKEVQLPGIPDDIEKITMNSIITHGKDAAMECTLHFQGRDFLEVGVFVTFKSAGKNVIQRVNIFQKASG